MWGGKEVKLCLPGKMILPDKGRQEIKAGASLGSTEVVPYRQSWALPAPEPPHHPQSRARWLLHIPQHPSTPAGQAATANHL